MKKFFIFISLFVVLISCSNNNELKVYEFVTEKEIRFPIDNPQKGIPEFDMFDYAIIDGIETIIVPIQQNRLAFYNLATKKEYHSIPLLKRNIDEFSYINKDSIFVLYEPDFADDTHTIMDTTGLQLLNYNGDIKICKFYVDLSEKNTFDKTDILPLAYSYNRLLIENGKLFIPARKYNWNIIGSKSFFENQYPLFVSYDTKTEEVKVSKSIQYPYIKENTIYHTRYPNIFYCLSKNNLPVLRFFYSSDVFEWHYKNDKLVKHNLKSKLLDTIYPLRSENSTPESLNTLYSKITYDPYNEIYYSYLLIYPYISLRPYVIIILADKNFNYLGEIVNPVIGGQPIYTKNNIITYFCDNDSILVQYKKLVKTNRSLLPYLDSVKKLIEYDKSLLLSSYQPYEDFDYPLIAYLDVKFPKKEKDYVLLTIYENQGCMPCENSIKKIISQYHKTFAKQPFYMIITGNKQSVIDGTYETFRNLNLIQDTFGIAQHFAYEENKYTMLNPRLTIVKNDVVVLDTIYDSFHIESDLIPTMLESLGLKQ